MTTATLEKPADVRERPILFSGPMVRAILDGTKTQTRRVLKPQPEPDEVGNPYWQYLDNDGFWTNEPRRGPMTPDGFDERQTGYYVEGDKEWRWRGCPYGKPGDRLWVKETWQAWTEFNNTKADALPPHMRERLNFLADGNNWDARIRPSIHMPRWASRLTLEIVSVRVERVQDITEQDAIAEGAQPRVVPIACYGLENPKMPPIYRMAFQDLWDSINAKRGFGWDVNPFCWVVEFKRVTAPPPGV